ncbi:ArsR/SmtB family transcription factor [Actinomarinicola tropica]|uniref:Metalloregulator ArsR/SmtB family transcription factor n=1 Tax=Actinomarinicola tropica TaxID=2789776 RepID=A0A5Q2RC79_9ACTN|nr:metalloregulator ArsR/SmtB family transcription factor [Actinomarinicola tropica]QGG94448.1 metalloregulator ArsR/SmtB family transcription factor [Actinomarinicola tropica]
MSNLRPEKDALHDGFAAVAKALASGRRTEIVDLLAQAERSVEQVAREIDQSVANTSHHLRTLATAGLVRSRRDGQHVRYRLASDRVADLWAALRDVAGDHAAPVPVLAAAYMGERDDIEHEPLDVGEVLARVRAGEVALLDVRPRLEYLAGHLPGAASVPVEELGGAVDELPSGVDVVVYCRGPYCRFADDAVRRLRAAGRTARRLDGGVIEWRRAGGPVDIPPAA